MIEEAVLEELLPQGGAGILGGRGLGEQGAREQEDENGDSRGHRDSLHSLGAAPGGQGETIGSAQGNHAESSRDSRIRYPPNENSNARRFLFQNNEHVHIMESWSSNR